MPTKNSSTASLGRAIRAERLRAELSQQQLAARIGVSQGTISFWERDVEAPTLDNLVSLIAYLPDLAKPIREHHFELVEQLRQIERALFDGGCACENCQCKEHTGPDLVDKDVSRNHTQQA